MSAEPPPYSDGSDPVKQPLQVNVAPAPIAMAVPVATVIGVPSGPPAAQMMTDMPAILVKQKTQVIDILMEKRNKYKIAPLHDLSLFTEEWDAEGWSNAQTTFKAKEESECLQRVCLKKWRTFDMDIFVGDSDDVKFKLHRPLKCNYDFVAAFWPCWPICCPIACCFPQEISATDPDGNPLGKVKHDCRPSSCCCTCYAKVYDEEQRTQYVFRDSCCSGCNCCAPSCCIAKHRIDILDASEANVVGSLENFWPGCNLRALLMSSNYKMVFPPDADEKQRQLLFAGLMLIEFMLFEQPSN